MSNPNASAQNEPTDSQPDESPVASSSVSRPDGRQGEDSSISTGSVSNPSAEPYNDEPPYISEELKQLFPNLGNCVTLTDFLNQAQLILEENKENIPHTDTRLRLVKLAREIVDRYTPDGLAANFGDAIRALLGSIEGIGELSENEEEFIGLMHDINQTIRILENLLMALLGEARGAQPIDKLSSELSSLRVDLANIEEGKHPKYQKRRSLLGRFLLGSGESLKVGCLFGLAKVVGLMMILFAARAAISVGATNFRAKDVNKAVEALNASILGEMNNVAAALDVFKDVPKEVAAKAKESQEAAGGGLHLRLLHHPTHTMHHNVRMMYAALRFQLQAKLVTSIKAHLQGSNDQVTAEDVLAEATGLQDSFLDFLVEQAALALHSQAMSSRLDAVQEILDDRKLNDEGKAERLKSSPELDGQTCDQEVDEFKDFINRLKTFLEYRTTLVAQNYGGMLLARTRSPQANIPEDVPSSEQLLGELESIADTTWESIPVELLPAKHAEYRENPAPRTSVKEFIRELIIGVPARDGAEYSATDLEVHGNPGKGKDPILRSHGSKLYSGARTKLDEALKRAQELSDKLAKLSPEAETRMKRAQQASEKMESELGRIRTGMEELSEKIQKLHELADKLDTKAGMREGDWMYRVSQVADILERMLSPF